jgi:cytolysin-activating lysine-acyltransferase
MIDEKTIDASKLGASTPSAVLGEMVWLYSKSKLHQTWAIGSIQQWLMPAIYHKQYRLYHKNKRPVGLVTWGWFSADVETAYVRNPRGLQPKDWKSGDRGWMLDFVAPFGDALRIGHDLKHTIFAHDVGRFLRVKEGSDTMNISYIHGAKAIAKAQDWNNNPTVDLGQDKGKPSGAAEPNGKDKPVNKKVH